MQIRQKNIQPHIKRLFQFVRGLLHRNSLNCYYYSNIYLNRRVFKTSSSKVISRRNCNKLQIHVQASTVIVFHSKPFVCFSVFAVVMTCDYKLMFSVLLFFASQFFRSNQLGDSSPIARNTNEKR